jgi:ribosomal protein L35
MTMASKSFTKRIRITRTGKVVRRPMRLDHFKTRKSANNVRSKRKTLSLDYPLRNL